MKVKTSLLVAIASALLFTACNYTNPAATTTAPPTATTPTATVSVAPTTGSTTVNDLNAELNATVDDGGQSDLKQLQKDAQGL